MDDDSRKPSQVPLLPPLTVGDERFSDTLPSSMLQHRVRTESPPPLESRESESVESKNGGRLYFDDAGMHIIGPAGNVTSKPKSLLSLLRGLKKLPGTLDTRLTRWIRGSRFHGWRMGVLLGCCMSSFVLCCNIAMIVVAAASKTGDHVGGIANLKIGDEAIISQWNTALHVLINALSTMLLAGSNYTMQVLSSPTRQDVDAAHARGQWLDIGVLSPRNLRLIPRKRAALWYTLALSSVPLHLFYNASIFKVVTSSEYRILTVDVASDEWNRINSTTDVGKSTNGTYWNLGGGKWTTVYDNEYISVHGDLYLAIDRVAFDTLQTEINSEAINITPRYLDYNVTGNQSTLRDLTSESASWITFRSQPEPTIQWMSISAHVVQAAGEKRKSPPSRVQVSLYFLIIVAVFNLLKLSVMAYVLITDRSAYLVTLGDAAASFLEHPDRHTTGICALGREELLITMGHPSNRPFSTPEEKIDLDSRVKGAWLSRSQAYFAPVHRSAKVLYTFLLLFVVLTLALGPLYTSSGHWGWGIGSDDNVPFGSDGTTATATLWNAWLANVPQLILSFFYLSVNMICTAMSGANEWNHLAKSQKGLRVTKPFGDQRSTYFLQLPYRWSLPLIVTSGTLHWLLSQTFFLVRADFYDRYGVMLEGATKSACGFSALSLYVLLFAALSLLGVVFFIGVKRMAVKVPTAGSCSLVISAACHPPPGQVDIHLARVQWGVVPFQYVEGFLHCSLSSTIVTEPMERTVYR